MRLKLTPSKAQFALNAFSGNTSFKIEFQEVILYVHRVEINPSVVNGHATGMKNKIPFIQSYIVNS